MLNLKKKKKELKQKELKGTKIDGYQGLQEGKCEDVGQRDKHSRRIRTAW